MTDQVLTFLENGVGHIRLNRPKAIHALTLEMCTAMIDALLAWQKNDSVEVILLDHNDGRGFCAGGDIAMVAKSAKGDCSEAELFFHTQNRLDHLLFTYSKPIVAFIDGIVMGGGVGISAPARYRVATERTLFAMPESGIGLFPDVGGGWHLPRLPGRTGAWLATTGSRINGADCLAIGIATHYTSSDKLEALKSQILQSPKSLADILDAASETPTSSSWEAIREDIDKLFTSNRYEDILAALSENGSEWAQTQLNILATKSPQTIKVALRHLAQGALLTDFAENMRNEYRLGYHILRRPDFVEGVRAVIFDKDNAPRWNPSTPEGVTDELIDSLFAPLPPEKEWTPLPQLLL